MGILAVVFSALFLSLHTSAHLALAQIADGEALCMRPISSYNASHFDAILLPGGGQTPTGPPSHVVLRLERALEM